MPRGSVNGRMAVDLGVGYLEKGCILRRTPFCLPRAKYLVMRAGWCTSAVVPTLVTQPFHAFLVVPAPALFSAKGSEADRHRSAWRARRPKTAVLATKKSASDGGDCDRGADSEKIPRKRGGKAPRASRGKSNGGRVLAGTKRRNKSASASSPTEPPPRHAAAINKPRSANGGAGRMDPFDADMHVLVPVKDVVTAPLADISQAAADYLGGGEATRLAIERFCMTLESVFRTEFSVKVDRANASLFLGGKKHGSAVGRSSRADCSSGGGGGLLAQRPQAGWTSNEARAPGASESGKSEAPAEAGPATVQVATDARDKGKHKWWKVGLWLEKRSQAAVGGKTEEEEAEANAPSASKTTVPLAKKRVRGGGGGGGGGRGNVGRKRKTSSRDDIDRAREAAVVPLLELVEELVRNAMFSPIGARDVMMSQALAAEFPTAADVRPVFGNLANVYELLRRQTLVEDEGGEAAGDGKNRVSAAGGAKRISDSERAMLPFEGRLLMFRRGNGVEETKGRLLLKKLDYLQSNAVGWLSQSVTDSLKACQQQAITAVENVARDVARRKDNVVRTLAEGAVTFGLERDSLARFLPPVANVTEMALTAEQEALNEALEALRRNSRRGPVNLKRYGLRQVNVDLEEFSEGGAWPPGDDSWFWETEPADGDTAGRDTQGRESGGEGSRGGEDSGAGEEVPSMVLPRVTLASVLRPRSMAQAITPNGAIDTKGTKSRQGGRQNNVTSSSSSSNDYKGKSALKRLLLKCTVKEPTYDEVVVVYYKRRRRAMFRPPSAVATAWRFGSRLVNRVSRGSEHAEADPEGDPHDNEGLGLGLQLRVYRGVPLVNLNAIAPDKKVEVRPQTALRLDLNSVVGLCLVLANLRFDSPVLVAAATLSVVLLVIRTIVGYLNARIRVESFVSRDILDKTMGSNVPVLRHLAEEAAQQKSRHVALVYAAVLQCAIDTNSNTNAATSSDPTALVRESAEGVEWDSLKAVSMAAVSRHCGAMMEACGGLPWESKVDVSHWLKELENLKILLRIHTGRDEDGGANQDTKAVDVSRSLPLSLERLNTPPAALETVGAEPGSSAAVEFYRLLDPEAAVGQLKARWSELVEPPTAASNSGGGSGSGRSTRDDATPWVRVHGVGTAGVSVGGGASDTDFSR